MGASRPKSWITCLGDADAGAIVFDEVAAAAVGDAVAARRLPRIAIGGAEGGTCLIQAATMPMPRVEWPATNT
jgi:hypothetical protein